MKSSLLATKLHRPSLPTKWVERPYLTQRLQEELAFNRKLTLVSAPAGFGKTTCISEWLNRLEDYPIAWLSLDAADNDPGRFFTYFIAALQTVSADLGQEISVVLHSGQLPTAESIGTTLINDLLAVEKQFLLVLDDFHLIQDAFVLQVLETVITNQPPLLHLVFITREDPPLPLARLRANDQLTEIRAKDLRFTSQDAARFLNEALNLSLSAADIAALEAKTEGWIVGLQLAALSIRDRTDPSTFIANLSGSHRFILDYLTEQVLSQQPDEIQHFLLQTSVLDKFNSELCNAVTGRVDGRILLDQLLKANLFLIPLDDAQQWYRYHHLFADLLRHRQHALGQAETAVLHQRASQWFAQANMVNEAMYHALAAEDFGTAVALLEEHALELIMQGYVKTVNGWVEAIPEMWRSQSHRTNLAFAWMHMLRGAYAQAARHLDQLENAFTSSQAESDQVVRAEWLVMNSLRLNMVGKAAEALALGQEAAALVPEQDNRVASLVHFGLATTYQMLEDDEAAVAAYRKAIQHGQAAHNFIAEMLSVSGLGTMVFERGQLHLAYEITAPVCERVEQARVVSPITTVVYGLLGEIYYQWHQVPEARRYFQRALALSQLGGYKSGMVGCRVLLSRLALLAGDVAAAADSIKAAIALIPAEVPGYVRQEAAAQQVCVYLAQDRLVAAQSILQEQGFSFADGIAFPANFPEQPLSHSLGLLYTSGLRLLLCQARSGRNLSVLETAVPRTNQLVEAARQQRLVIIALHALLLRAQMHALLGAHRASEADYRQALQLAEVEGFVAVFVEQGVGVKTAVTQLHQQHKLADIQPDYLKRLLAALASSPAQSRDGRVASLKEPSALIEPLTDREREVLNLMAEGLKYKEIAARLVVSVNTVRYHVKAIYSKLSVNNRTQALDAARQQHIL